MLKNFIKIAWRNILRHKTNTAINVIGLALGMTCCLFIFLWVQDEKNFDNFHANSKNIYKVYQTSTSNGKVDGGNATFMVESKTGLNANFLMEDAKQSVPEIKYQCFYATGYELPWGHPETFQVGEKKMKFDGSRAGEDFFKIFSFTLLAGNAENALKNMNNVAISRKMAEIFFGTPQNAIGKTMRFENRDDFPLVVSAVFENVPSNSSLKFDFLLSWEAFKRGRIEMGSIDFRTFIMLADNANAKDVEKKLNQFLQPRLDKNTPVKLTAGLQLFSDEYLHSIFVNGKPIGGRIEYIRIFSGVAIFLLIIACINFMNLATARSVKRAKEIGLRKVVGSSRGNLIGQFFSEALVFAFMAMLLSVILLFIFLPAFNHFTNKHIEYPFTNILFWLSLVAITAITGIVAGSYPALYLSSLQPVRILKGVVRFSQSSLLFRKGLTVFQFVLSITLIIATIVISRQTNFIQNTHLGYDKENLIYIRIEGELQKRDNYLLFKNTVSNMPGIAMVDRSSETPHEMSFVVADAINYEGKQKNDHVGFKPSSVGFDFIKLMKMDIAYGRDFSHETATDSTDAFMVNEEAVREMGMKNPIGKWISAWAKKGHIIAVLKDYHTASLREPIKPIIIDIKEDEYFGVIMVRTQPGKTKEALASLEKAYKDLNPAYPFAYQFLDQEYKNLYGSELVISKLSIVFAALAILISCLGLFGLVMFAAEQRIKEIGVRKVLGASLSQIFNLFSKDFLKLICIAFLIAAPIAWYSMHDWLNGFAYKIDFSWWIFALSAFLSILIALITISYQAIKAAKANPVKSLRTE
ncbi:MAG: ABC transporter permease [Bacteroidetes bacterium]|nr:ABC transporter permease [Bacteroidota bacterium]